MRTVSAGWRAAARASAYEPVWLVELAAFGRRFVTRRLPATGVRAIGDGARIGTGLVLGSAGPALEYDLQAGTLPTIAQTLRDTTGRVEVSAVRIVLLNQSDLASSVPLSAIENSAVDIRLGFYGLPLAEYCPVWTGVVDRTDVSRRQWTLECLDASVGVHRDLSRKIGAEYFVAAQGEARNRAIPILIGGGVDLPAIQVTAPATGLLAFAIDTAATVLYVREYGSGFPASGVITVEAESLSYTSRAAVNIGGVTYLALRGLSRGAPVSHAVGSQVSYTAGSTYLLAYALSTVSAVKEAGVLRAPASYTLTRFAGGADRPVTTLFFAPTPTGAITFDAVAANVELADRLTNGGFETGDLTGWTLDPGVIASAGTASPPPAAGTYRASIQGGLATLLGIYQDVPTVVGETYQVRALLRTSSASSLVTNGGFETGDLTGWTTQLDTQADVAVGSGVVTPDLVTSLPAGGLADGEYSLIIRAASGYQGSGFQAELTTDVTVTAGLTYAASFTYATFQYFFTGGGNNANVNGSTSVAVSVGTAALPGKYVARQAFAATNVYADGQRLGGFPGGINVATVVFTPAETSIRLTVIATGQAPGSAPVVIDGVRVQLAGVLDTASASVTALPLPSGPAYFTQTVTAREQWSEVSGQFRATTTSTRLAVRSSYAQTPQPGYVDEVSLIPVLSATGVTGGENPVDAITYLIRTFLPQLVINTASFQAAHTARQGWRFRAYLATPGESRALLLAMAEQAELIYYEDAQGRAALAVQDVSGMPVAEYGPANMVEESFSALAEPLDNLASHLYVWYGLRGGLSQSSNPSDYAGSVYATPEGTSDTSQPHLATQCAQALRMLRRPVRRDLFLTLVADVATATLKLRAVVARVTVRSTDYTWRTWLDAAALEVGDLVQIVDPRQQDPVPQEAQITAVSLVPDAAQVALTARGLRPAEVRLEMELGPVFVELDGRDLEFEFADAVVELPGLDLEFEPDEITARRRVRSQEESDDE